MNNEKWLIDKEFGFDYGHRVHTQRLNKEFSMDDACVCKHLHGHRGQVHVFLESTTLTGGFVTDFKHLNWLKQFLDDNIDHKFVLDLNDPWFTGIINATIVRDDNGTLTELIPTTQLQTSTATSLKVKQVFVPGTNHFAGYELETDGLSGSEQEFFEGFFMVEFVPTSENLSKWVYDCVDSKMSKINIQVTQIDWWETPKSRSSYRKS